MVLTKEMLSIFKTLISPLLGFMSGGLNIFICYSIMGLRMTVRVSVTFHLTRTCVYINLVRFRLLSGHLLGNS